MGRRDRKSSRKHQKPSDSRQPVDVVSPGLRAARTLWMQGLYDESLRTFDATMRQEPNNVRACVDAARAYASRFELAKAEERLQRLTRIAPNRAGVYHLAGDTYSLLKLLPQAIASYEQAAELPDVMPLTLVELASLYERSHRVVEAQSLIEQALRAEPGLPPALLVQSRLLSRQQQDDQAETLCRSIISTGPADSELVSRAWAEIASIKDRLEEFDAAMHAMQQCKQLQLARGEADWQEAERIQVSFARLVETISAADFQRWQQSTDVPDRQRVALLTGFPRSGTTLLEKILDAHPDLVSSEERDFLAKEMFPSLQRHYGTALELHDVLSAITTERWARERQRYLSVMEWMLGESIGQRLHLDKNPAYNLVIPVMLRLFPESKLLIALRDPRDVIISCYLTYLPLNPVSVRFLTLERAAEKYALDMGAWLKFRELIPSSWCEIRYEDVVQDLETTVRRVVESLGLPWCDEVLAYRQQLQDKQVSSPTYAEVSQPVFTRSIGRWRNYAAHLQPVLETLQPFAEEFGYA